METCCVLCNLSLDSMEGVGLIGNGGLVCRKCYVADQETAREMTGRNPIPEFVFESDDGSSHLIREFPETKTSQVGQ
jgi:hypothetical protein